MARNSSTLFHKHKSEYKVIIDDNDRTYHLYHLNASSVTQSIIQSEINYSQMTDLLREANDAQFGIVSTLQADGTTWLRDATSSIPLLQRIQRNAPVIEANNALLRCLSRLRPIDYAVENKLKNNATELQKELQDDMRNRFAELTKEILEIAQSTNKSDKVTNKSDKVKNKEIKEKEKVFNTFLVRTLHEADLTSGCTTEKDAQKLLFHYRNLSSVLEPARILITLIYDRTVGIFQRETQYPVTTKTEEQKTELKKLKEITPHPSKDGKNAHSVQKTPFQEADSLFADRLQSDDTALGAQARKSHLVGVKNAFIVKNELVKLSPEDFKSITIDTFDTLAAEGENILWLARMGSPAYVGKGENTKAIQTHTRQNFEQMRLAAIERMRPNADLKLHVTTLNTNIRQDNQDKIIQHVKDATVNLKHGVSIAPTNYIGTAYPLEIDPALVFGSESGDKPRQTAFVSFRQKANRVEAASKIVLAACKTGVLSIVHCASGQDRTGTVVEKVTQEWMKKRYDALKLNTENIDHMRAEGGNAAEINSHYITGSPGVKEDSLANNLRDGKTTFTKEATEQMYLSSAKTNKKNEVNDVSFLSKPSSSAIKKYGQLVEAFETNLGKVSNLANSSSNEILSSLNADGRGLLEYVTKMVAGKPEQLKAEELKRLNTILYSANSLTESLGSTNEPKTPDELNQCALDLQNAVKDISDQSSQKWRDLKGLTLIFVSVALIAVGIAFAAPTGGASLIATAAGAYGLYDATNRHALRKAEGEDLKKLAKDFSNSTKTNQYKTDLSNMKKEKQGIENGQEFLDNSCNNPMRNK